MVGEVAPVQRRSGRAALRVGCVQRRLRLLDVGWGRAFQVVQGGVGGVDRALRGLDLRLE